MIVTNVNKEVMKLNITFIWCWYFALKYQHLAAKESKNVHSHCG